MTDLLFNPALGPLNARSFALGKVFFVDQINGNNDNNGIDPRTPFATITYALAQSAASGGANRHDYIYVMWTQDGSEPLYPIDINVNWVHLIGISGTPGPLLFGNINGGGLACFEVTASGTEIAGFGFHTTGAASVGLDMSANPYAGWIHHCQFAVSATVDGLLRGIGGPGQQLPWWRIEDNLFNSTNGVGITTSCITGDLIMNVIRRNIFTCCAGGASPCIWTGNIEIGPIVDNYFYCPISDTGMVGWAIFLEGLTLEGGPITNNHAMQTGDGTGLNPYRDTSSPGDITAVSHGWGMNYSGQAVVTPAAV